MERKSGPLLGCRSAAGVVAGHALPIARLFALAWLIAAGVLLPDERPAALPRAG